jgi:putative PIN family toxin of toxin-antitoxin system
MKLILDSNVIIAAFAGRGLCNSLFELCLEQHDIFISDFILLEVRKNLSKKLNLPTKKADMIITYLKEFCLVGHYNKLKIRVCRDKDDDEILGLAKGVRAQYIITGDSDLLSLKKFELTEIISPRQFWEIAKKSHE